ncbi:hypothetical protein NDU88_002953 [Pleurodeles waltl]|uniref:Uncharacterized protein n=1 Tax=Pleurodeles waltl TaxID=8319 RepID=A0AAV7WMQ1_PLEWA|nr:hypothetical protein NDU88_002953 [Pleurodeles waltl]
MTASKGREFEERNLGGENKMAVPCTGDNEAIIVISDEEDRQEEQMILAYSTGEPVVHITPGEGSFRQFIPRIVSPMLSKVQEWKVENQKKIKAGEQREFADSSGLVMRGNICGETSGNGEAGRAQLRLDLWQSGVGASQSGCDGTHALGKHEEQSTRQLGWPAQVQRLPVKVGAPSGHRIEKRAQSGRVRLTTGRQQIRAWASKDFYPLQEGVPYTSRSAGVADQEVIDDVLLDYEEEDESEEVFSGQLRAV